MRIHLATGLLAMFLMACHSTKIPADLKKASKQLPGVRWVKDNLLMDEAEITNLYWLEYMYWLKTNYGEEAPEYINALPDTAVWITDLSYGEPFMQSYFRHPAYHNYPVVGVTYEQADAYCKWRTDRIKENGDRPDSEFQYRLPTIEEWEFAASGGLDKNDYPYGRIELTQKGQYLFNIREQPNRLTRITAPVYAYTDNDFGLYNLVGNVAEMVAEKGVSKGGSFLHSLESGKISATLPYDGPQRWLGFRCICELQEGL